MVVAAFVAPFLLPRDRRGSSATAAQLPGVRLGVVTTTPADAGAAGAGASTSPGTGGWTTRSTRARSAAAVTGLSRQLGRVERLVGALEQLQVPLAQVREALGIAGMDVATAHNVRDKARMKAVLRRRRRAVRPPPARHAAPAEALAFAEEVGFPLVAKPPAGAGAQATYRLDDVGALAGWLAAVPPAAGRARAARGVPRRARSTRSTASPSAARPSGRRSRTTCPPPLEVLRNPWIQWTVLLPRELDGPRYGGIHEVGPAALRALGVRDALTHMEWFRRPDGSVAVSEVGARPPGAQLSSMLGYVHDVDFYRTWAELVILDRFDPPERRYAAGTAYLRGQGRGRVRAVHGVEEVQRQLGHLVVEARLPEPGQPASSSYEGEGYVIVRDPDTEVVRDALHRIVDGVRVELVEAQ